MEKAHKMFRSLSTNKEFDGDDGDSVSSSSSSSGSHNGALISRHDASVHLFHMSLVEHMCRIYEADPVKSKQLFKVICDQLCRMKMMNPLSQMDELSGLRTKYQMTFSRMLHTASNVINKVGPQTMVQRAELFLQPRLPLMLPSADSVLESLHPSRYHDEFIQLDSLGKGAYGSVYKAQHKVDGCCYAVKKVAFEGDSPDMLKKILREARLLATLSHPHIVRYYNAWLENSVPWISPKPTPFPAITNSDSSDGIVFEGSADGGHEDMSVDEDTGYSIGGSTAANITPCLVLHIQMELCTTTLADWIKQRNARLSSDDEYSLVDEAGVERIMKQLLRALAFIHHKGFIHRDVKPKNIFLSYNTDSTFHVKLGDFGLSRTSRASPTTPMTPHPGFKWPNSRKNQHIPHRQQTYNSNSGRVKHSDCDSSRANDEGAQANCDTSVPSECIAQTVANNSESASSELNEKSSNSEEIDHTINTQSTSSEAPPALVFSTVPKTSRTHEEGSSLNVKFDSSYKCPGLSEDDGSLQCSSLCEDEEHLFTSGVGTTIYAAPEQLCKTTYTTKVDMYSLGVVMYELYQPFSTEMERIHCINQARGGTILHKFTKHWPDKSCFISALLACDPERRPSAQELLDGELFHSKQQIIFKLKDENVSLSERNKELEKLLQERDAQIMELKKNRSRHASFCEVHE